MVRALAVAWFCLSCGGPLVDGARCTTGVGCRTASESLLEARDGSGFPITRNLMHLAAAAPAGRRGAPIAGDARMQVAPNGPAGSRTALADFNWDLLGGHPDGRDRPNRRSHSAAARVKEERDELAQQLPEKWRQVLAVRDLRIAYQGPRSIVFVGRSDAVSEPDIAVKVMDGGPIARNEVRMLRRLRNSGNVVTYISSKKFPNATYILMAAADGTLHDHIMEQRKPTLGHMTGRMPLEETLPILVDLLRGIIDLDEQGIVHADLWGRNVLMKGGRPLLTGFGRATVIDPADKDFGNHLVAEVLRTSADASRTPPETIMGHPTGPSNNVWQVGAVFALMTLGHVPMTRVLIEHLPDFRRDGAEVNASIRSKAQDIIRGKFLLTEDPLFKKQQDEDVKDILLGLLAPSLDKRWTAKSALRAVLNMAAGRGIEVPPERSAPAYASRVPGDWE